MTDIPASRSTTAHITVGDSFVGTIDIGGDHDWIAVDLVAGEKYTFTLDGYGSTALEDPYLYLRSPGGRVLVENDDGDGNRNSRIVFTATTTGTYYLDAAAWDDATGTYKYTGDYKLTAEHFTAPPVYTFSQIADQLVNGYWGGDWHHFNVTQGGTITVNVTALTAPGQTLARAALQEWADVIGVHFKEVATGGQIVFDDSEDGAFTNSVWSNHIISSSSVNVSTQWLTDYGTTTDSYAFQSYVHEIGHALGLGHGGNYNDTATYPDDALYANDAWSTTVMSYFSQHDSSYFSDQGFSEDFALTPMSADILAMQTLYGLSTTTRTGDTIYGYGNTSGNLVFDTATNPHAAYTIVDSGGIDTLNYSKTSANELINLNPLTFSNVAGDTGNVSIAVGTVIENATSGGGNDTIVGNAADNVLNGGGGNDTVSYEAATAGVKVNLSLSTAQNTVGAGTDTLKNFENVIGSAFDDRLTAAATTQSIAGGDGNDRIDPTAASGAIHVDGNDGDDWIIGGAANPHVDGGNGFDTVDFSTATAGITWSLSTIASSYLSIEQVIGTAFADDLSMVNYVDGVVNKLIGGAGDDTLRAVEGAVQMEGGAGNDTYYVVGPAPYNPYSSVSVTGPTMGATATIIEAAGQGTDLVQSEISFTLPNNVENLQLVEGQMSLDTDGTGNALANRITGDSGANVLSGLGGNDFLYGNGGNDTLDGGTGNDRLTGGAGDDTYIAGSYGDVVVENVGEGTDQVFASADFVLRANVEDLTLTGSAGIWGKGNELDNDLNGNSGNNRLFAFAGNDVIDGKGGVDQMFGGTGDDIYYVDNYGDRVIENPGEGTDSVFASAKYKLGANVENLTLTGTSDIWGYGNASDNTLMGNSGANKLYGMTGTDTINGGGGNDWIEGGAGKDTLTGGAGSDTFVFRDGDFGGATTGTADHILDFTQGDDTIRLNYVDANTTLTGDQAFHFMGTAAFDGHAGELRYAEISGNTYISGDTDGDGHADFMIRVDGLHTLASSDFIL